MDTFVKVSEEAGVPLKHLLELVQQVENGASPAFLARYRADLCAGLNEERVHGILRQLHDHRDLIDHRISMLTRLNQEGVLTPELKKELEEAGDRGTLNDVFRPYRFRNTGPAEKAIDVGLDPLARQLWFQEDGVDIPAEAASYVDPAKGIGSPDEALTGAYAIASKWLSEKPAVLRELRKLCRRDCEVVVSVRSTARREPRYKALDGLRAKAAGIDWRTRLALRRGVRTNQLQMKVEFPITEAARYLERCLIKDPDSVYGAHLKQVVDFALRNGLIERVKKDVDRRLDDEADAKALDSYCTVLRKTLMGPVAHGLNILGLETGRPGGWRAALIDGDGNLVGHSTVRSGDGDSSRRRSRRRTGKAQATRKPATNQTAGSGEASPTDLGTDPVEQANSGDGQPGLEQASGQGKQAAGKESLSDMLAAHDVDLIVYASGPRQRSVERFVRSQIRKSGKIGTAWLATRHGGTWIFAKSRMAKREFPKLEPAVRSAISLARRVQDPMAELVKSDLRMLGIGSHHHEVDSDRLREALRLTVQRAVHDVGVDVNRASSSLLALVPGFTERLARRVVSYRGQNGPFRSRRDLLKVDGLSERIYAHSVGFLRVFGGEPLDGTGAHPEYHELHEDFAKSADCDLATLLAEPDRLDAIDPEEFVTEERPAVFVRAALDEFRPERRQPRATLKLPEPAVPLRLDSELTPGCKVKGVVASIADFGVFVDIGGNQDALLHISQIKREHKRDSKPTLQVGDPIEVYVKRTEKDGKRVGLSMWNPNSSRNRNGARPPRTSRDSDWSRRRRKRQGGRSDRKKPFSRTFGPVSGQRGKRGRTRLSLEEKLGMLQDKYRTKV